MEDSLDNKKSISNGLVFTIEGIQNGAFLMLALMVELIAISVTAI